ncbi:MAG: CRTAC1 family protein [Verrucomicrobia bacterium]|nr:CRTAC1 family protein [Verrucomicrobiota bacterium]
MSRFYSIFFALAAAAILVASENTPIRFSDRTKEAGLQQPLSGMLGHGGAWGDFDGDGKIDLFVGGFCDRPNAEYAPAPGPVPNRLFRNLGDGRFEWAQRTAVETRARASGAVFADLDNNGTLELYVANNAQRQSRRADEPQRSAQLKHSQLFNNEDGKFRDFSAASGACPDGLFTARNVGLLDYNRDGLLDLFLVEDKFSRGGQGPRSVLMKNRGGLKFQAANRETGLPDDIFGLGLAVADLNEDNRPDFLVGHPNRLFLSQSDGTFREATELQAIFRQTPLDGEDWPCGVAFGDLNRDGQPDLVISVHYRIARNRVFLNGGLNQGIPQFRDVTREVGLEESVPVKCPHVEVQDFDNDGWPDIYLSAAWLEQGQVIPLIYRNAGLRDGLPRFAPPRPVSSSMVYFPAGPSGDFDNDGRLDLFLVNWFSDNHSRLLRNETPRNNWLQVRVSGTTFNRMGIGAKIRVLRSAKTRSAGKLLGYQEVAVGYGYASGQPALCHFGLGDETEVDLQIIFPNGAKVERAGVKANQLLKITEP